ncbi:MAG: hypothetical protein PHC75_02940 [Burkholderiales bacterium]|nr:hypothetical protein [Burkholderiales bacterium]
MNATPKLIPKRPNLTIKIPKREAQLTAINESSNSPKTERSEKIGNWFNQNNYYSGIVYRADSRPPETILQEGFKLKANNTPQDFSPKTSFAKTEKNHDELNFFGLTNDGGATDAVGISTVKGGISIKEILTAFETADSASHIYSINLKSEHKGVEVFNRLNEINVAKNIEPVDITYVGNLFEFELNYIPNNAIKVYNN